MPPATPPKSQPPLLGAEDKPDDVHPLGVDEVDDASLHVHGDIIEYIFGETPENQGPTMVTACIEYIFGETPENEGPTMVTASSGSSAPQGSGKDWQAEDPCWNLRDNRNLRSRSRSKH